MWRWPGGKPASLALSLPGSIFGRSPIFRVTLALLLLNYLDLLILRFNCCENMRAALHQLHTQQGMLQRSPYPLIIESDPVFNKEAMVKVN